MTTRSDTFVAVLETIIKQKDTGILNCSWVRGTTIDSLMYWTNSADIKIPESNVTTLLTWLKSTNCLPFCKEYEKKNPQFPIETSLKRKPSWILKKYIQ